MMKRILSKSLPVACTLFAVNAGAQITIDYADFPVSQNQHRTTYNWVGNDQMYTTPTEGPNQIWDYQGFISSGPADYTWSAATEPFFSDGYHYEAAFGALGAFTIRADYYRGFDNISYYALGKQQYDTIFSISAITGGANDQVHFIDAQELYGTFPADVLFPMSYGSQWTTLEERTHPFELTVDAMGLSNTPGYYKGTIVGNREVVGYGKLVMSHPITTISDSMDVLLLKESYTMIDSFFVGGMPAPPSLLAGLGLTQGSSEGYFRTYFFRQGYGDVLIEFMSANDLPESPLINARFNENGVLASTVGIEEKFSSSIGIYPNPVKSGSALQLDFNQPNTELSEIGIYSLTGKKIRTIDFVSFPNGNISLDLPSELTSGHYLVQGSQLDGVTVFREKLIIVE